jgi:hypothetical protein
MWFALCLAIGLIIACVWLRDTLPKMTDEQWADYCESVQQNSWMD